MKNGPPALIAIDYDDYHASHVGRIADGRQFFVTTPFGPLRAGEPHHAFLAVYVFDAQGSLVQAHIDDLGDGTLLDEDRRCQLLDESVAELGPVEYGRIEVQPFEIERFGIPFGLIPRPSIVTPGDWWVELQPGNFMAFHEPWDSGVYDT